MENWVRLLPVPPFPRSPEEEPVVKTLSSILWPSFLAAGVGEMLVFAFFDPMELLGDEAALSRTAIYSLAFLAFWMLMACSSALTWLLQRSADEINRCPLPAPERPHGCPRR